MLVGKAGFLFSPFLGDSTVINLNQILFVFGASSMLPQPGNTANPRTLDIGSLLEMKKNGQVASGNYWFYSHNSPANRQMFQDEKLELEVTRKKEKEWKKRKYCYLFHRKTTLYLGRSPKGDPSMKFRLILSIH